jgi:hypothetical protein
MTRKDETFFHEIMEIAYKLLSLHHSCLGSRLHKIIVQAREVNEKRQFSSLVKLSASLFLNGNESHFKCRAEHLRPNEIFLRWSLGSFA